MAIGSELIKSAALGPLMRLYRPINRGTYAPTERQRLLGSERPIIFEAGSADRRSEALLAVDRVVQVLITQVGAMTDDDGTIIAALPGALESVEKALNLSGQSLFRVEARELSYWIGQMVTLLQAAADFYSSSDPEIESLIASYQTSFESLAAGAGAAKMAAFIAGAGTASSNVYAADLMLTGYAMLIEAQLGILDGDGDVAAEAVTHIEDLLDEMVSVVGAGNPWSGDGHIDWPVSGGDTLTDGSSMLNDFKGTQAMSRICSLIKNDATLDAELGARVDAILTILSDEIITKWLVDRTKSGIPAITWVRTVHTMSPSATKGYMQDLQLSVLTVCRNLYEAGVTGDLLDSASLNLKEFHDEVFASLKANVLDDQTYAGTQEDGTYLWHNGNYLWTKSALTMVPDVNHFGRLPRLLVESYRYGDTAVLPYITGLGRTFAQRIFTGVLELDLPLDLSQGKLEADALPATRNFINGRNDLFGDDMFQGSGAGMAGMPNDGWLYLGIYDRDVYLATKAMLAHVSASSGNTNAFLLRQRSPEYHMNLLGAIALQLRAKTW